MRCVYYWTSNACAVARFHTPHGDEIHFQSAGGRCLSRLAFKGHIVLLKYLWWFYLRFTFLVWLSSKNLLRNCALSYSLNTHTSAPLHSQPKLFWGNSVLLPTLQDNIITKDLKSSKSQIFQIRANTFPTFMV